MEPAPFHSNLADGPDGGHAVWAVTEDGVRIRIGLWPNGAKGTVLIFNGRTEYIEKYGRVAKDLSEAGFAVATCDWRGQGLSDRLSKNPKAGHVKEFADYQKDVSVFVETVRAEALPEPYYLIAHSLGGAIGLRALVDGLPVERAVFSGPMWGIRAVKTLGPIAIILMESYHFLGFGNAFVPGTNAEPYVLKTKFDGNSLTNDEDTWTWLQTHLRADPGLGLGGPSMNWLRESNKETKSLAKLSSVPCPTLAMVGSEESVIVKEAVLDFAAGWPNARAEVIEGARHEAMMETPDIRAAFMSKILDHFQA